MRALDLDPLRDPAAAIEHGDVALAEHADVQAAVGAELHAVGPFQLRRIEALDHVAEALAGAAHAAVAPRIAIDVPGQRLGDVEVLVGSEGNAVRELDAPDR